MAEDTLEQLVQQLLSPLSDTQPAGRWMRYERAFIDIARQREEDNPNLPMGEWERPLVKADWRKVTHACAKILTEDSKDFQVAAWLSDAWMRTNGLDGLCAGLDLIAGLAEHFWTTAWPALEDDDAERRVAPFVWMNTNLPLTLRLNTLLLRPVLYREAPVTLLDWERSRTADDAKMQEGDQLNRRAIRDSVKVTDAAWLEQIDLRSDHALAVLDRLSSFLDAQLISASPSLSKLRDAIESLKQAAQSLLQEIPPVENVMPSQEASNLHTASASSVAGVSVAQYAEQSGLTNAVPALSINATAIQDRQQAYAALMAIADYLHRLEPHSPTPYLIQRAVDLGQLSLPEMIRDVSASAGSLDRFFELLGITPPS